ncbi:MAG: hypothetical protein AB2541_16500 [Candidatus Thiodiazotropha sp.]
MNIAQRLNAVCPQDYKRAWIEAEVGDEWDNQTAWCEGPAGKMQPEIPPVESFAIGDALRDLRSQMTTPGDKPWSRCTFTLYPDSKFNFAVQYDD